VAGGLLGRLLGVLGGRERSREQSQPQEDPQRGAAERLEAARARLKQEIPPPEDQPEAGR
jgi:hypothetical protein